MIFPAAYFDGRSACLHAVELKLSGAAVTLSGAHFTPFAKSYPLHQTRLAEPFAQAPCVLDFSDGARVEIADGAARPALAAALGYHPTLVQRWQHRWPLALLALLLLVALIGAGLKWGIPALGERLVVVLPASVDRQLGDRVLSSATGKELFPSRLSDQRIAQVNAVFQAVRPANPRMPITLRVMELRYRGPNAMALPNGTIIMTDAMVRMILGKADGFDDRMRAQLAGVLAHEIGHIQRRHSMRAIVRSSLTMLGAVVLFGDFSSVVAGAPALLLQLDYSREMESEADAYALARLRELGISSVPLADLFDAMESKAGPARGVGAWIQKNAPYLSSHPVSAQRSAFFRGNAPQAD